MCKGRGGSALLNLSHFFLKYPMLMKLFHFHRIFKNGGGGGRGQGEGVVVQANLLWHDTISNKWTHVLTGMV